MKKALIKSFSLAYIFLLFFWFDNIRPHELTAKIWNYEALSFIINWTLLTILFVPFFFFFKKKMFFICCSYFLIFLMSSFGMNGFKYCQYGFNCSTLRYVIVGLFSFLAIVQCASAVYSKLFKTSRGFAKLERIDILHRALILLVPVALSTLVMLSMDFIHYSPISKENKQIASAEDKKGKIFWLIFDELDQNLLFTERLPQYQFPAFDQLKSEAIYCSEVRQPGPFTMTSISSYLTGEDYCGLIVKNKSTLMLKNTDLNWQSFHKKPSLFEKAQNVGYRSAVIGWHFPYSHMVNRHTNTTYDFITTVHDDDIDFLQAYSNQVKMFLTRLQQKVFKGLLLNKFKVAKTEPCYRAPISCSIEEKVKCLTANIFKVCSQSSNDFVLIHYPVPHYPTIFDVDDQRIRAIDQPCYYSNVALADKFLSELRTHLENRDEWETSTIIISSDHWLRAHEYVAEIAAETIEFQEVVSKREEPLVPLLIKLPYQKEGVEFDQPLKALVQHDLILHRMENPRLSVTDTLLYLSEYTSKHPPIRGRLPLDLFDSTKKREWVN